MKRIGTIGAWTLCLGMAIGCGGNADRTAEDARDENEIDISETTTVVETGCLTASGDRFVLASLEGGGAAETELYQLIGLEDELRPHVGREVRVNGMAEPAQVATVRETSPATPVGTSGNDARGGAGAAAEVQTEAHTKLETRRMRVTSVTPTGDECASAN